MAEGSVPERAKVCFLGERKDRNGHGAGERGARLVTAVQRFPDTEFDARELPLVAGFCRC